MEWIPRKVAGCTYVRTYLLTYLFVPQSWVGFNFSKKLKENLKLMHFSGATRHELIIKFRENFVCINFSCSCSKNVGWTKIRCILLLFLLKCRPRIVLFPPREGGSDPTRNTDGRPLQQNGIVGYYNTTLLLSLLFSISSFFFLFLQRT